MTGRAAPRSRLATSFAVMIGSRSTTRQMPDATFRRVVMPLAIPAVVALQLFAYYCAIERGCDIDQPLGLTVHTLPSPAQAEDDVELESLRVNAVLRRETVRMGRT